jgi:MFS family permease
LAENSGIATPGQPRWIALSQLSSRTRPTSSSTTSPAPRFAVTFIALGALVSALAQSLFVPVLPLLPGILGTSATNVQWLVTSTVLVGAIAVPIAGRLGDLRGKRLMLLISLAAMAIGSLITALSSTIGWLIIGRGLQGLAGGTVPLGISLVTATVPRHRQASGIALVSGMLGVGGALGLPMAGVITQYADYHVLFWITFAAAVLAFAGILLRVPEAPINAKGRLDVPGASLLALTLLALLLPLSEAGVWGWSDPRTWGLLIVAVILAALFGRSQWRKANPLVDVRTLVRRPVLLTDLASILIGFSMFGSILGTSSYVQAPAATGYGFGSSVAVAGLTLLPSGLAMLVLAPVAGRMIDRWGARVTLIVGALVVAAGWLMRIWLISGLAWIVIGTTVVGIGVALCFAAFPALINASVPPEQNASANGLNALFRDLGISLVSALCGSILATLTISLGAAVIPSLAAYRWIFGICAIGALLAAAMANVIPKKNK